MRVNVTTSEGTTAVVIPSAPTLTAVIGTRYAETSARTERTVVGDEDAVAGDQFKWIILDGGVNPAVYNIDPALFTGLTLFITAEDVTQGATVAVDSGVIQLKNGLEQTSVQLLAMQTIYLYADGTNLKQK